MAYGELVATGSQRMWRFNGAATDAGANGETITLGGTTSYQPGRIGSNCVATASNNGYLYRASACGITTASYTYSIWFNFDGNSSSPTLEGAILNSASSVSKNIHTIWYNPTTTNMYFVREGAPGYTIGPVTYALTVGRWYHIVYSYDSVAGYMYGYRDGAQIGTIKVTTPTGYASALNRTYFGVFNADNGGLRRYIWGKWDDLIIDPITCWSADRIRKYYTMCKGHLCPQEIY